MIIWRVSCISFHFIVWGPVWQLSYLNFVWTFQTFMHPILLCFTLNKISVLQTDRLNRFSMVHKLSGRTILRSGLQLSVLLIYGLHSSTWRARFIFSISFAFIIRSTWAFSIEHFYCKIWSLFVCFPEVYFEQIFLVHSFYFFRIFLPSFYSFFILLMFFSQNNRQN